jgi:hypothetical protein
MPRCGAEFQRLTVARCGRKYMVIFNTLDIQPNMPYIISHHSILGNGHVTPVILLGFLIQGGTNMGRF